ncbi:MAG: helical backbone metal receptor [Ginsengibacter sp.]
MIINNPESIHGNFKAKRIISLVPSLTELLSDLSLDEEVLGITKFCVHPKRWFRSKTRIGGTKNINTEIIHELSPDLIIANKEENVKEQIEDLSGSYNVLLTDINNLDTAITGILQIGKLTSRVDKSEKLATHIRERFNDLAVASPGETKVNAAYLIWNNPYMAAGGGTFIDDMMQYCGLRNVFSDIERYPVITLDDIQERECRFLLLSSEPYPFRKKHIDKIKAILSEMEIMLVDGEMFSWYGSRLLKSARYFKSLHTQLIHSK